MTTDTFTTHYAGLAGEVHIDFEPTAHEYGIGPSAESLEGVPSFSDIAEFLPKYLAAWAQNCGIDGTLALLDSATIERYDDGAAKVDLNRIPTDDRKFVLSRIKQLGMDHDSVRKSAADRGTMVHSAFRGFILNGFLPDPDDYSVGEAKGYIASLRMFCEAIKGRFDSILCEEPICSPSLGVAGTPDLFCELKSTRVQVGGNIGPGKRPKYDDVAGRCLIDLKTSAQVYTSHKWQLSAYSRMLTECGFAPPTERAIVLIKKNGEGYNWKPQPAISTEAIAALVRVWEAENRPEGWRHWSAPENWIDAE